MTSRTLFIIIVVTLVLIAGSIVAGNFIHFTTPPFQVTANSTSTSAPAPQPVTLALGSRNVMVGVVQQALIKQGYLQGSSTGVYDTSTQAAVKKFQEANGLAVTGNITIASSAVTSSFAAAASSFAVIGPSSSPAEISRIQAYFIHIGYLDIATATGVYGPATQAAVKKFQEAHRVPQTGVIDEATFAAMNGK